MKILTSGIKNRFGIEYRTSIDTSIRFDLLTYISHRDMESYASAISFYSIDKYYSTAFRVKHLHRRLQNENT